MKAKSIILTPVSCLLIPIDAAGTRFDRYLRTQFPHFKQAFIEKSLRKGLIRINGKKVTAAHRLTEGESVTIQESVVKDQEPDDTTLSAIASFRPIPEPWFIEPVWEDDDLLVINKPSGLAVQGGTKTRTHVDGLLQAYGAEHGQRYYLVHRLDRDTSGILVVAKNQATARHLAMQFRLHEVKKLYLAVVLGRWQHSQGTINAPLIKIGIHEKMVVDFDNGRPAKTEFRLVKRLTHMLNLVALTPQTGRTHQLRVHMQYIGNPIIGDGKYAETPAIKQTTQLHLHAFRLTITDRQGVALTFTAPLPEHFMQTITATGVDPDKILVNL